MGSSLNKTAVDSSWQTAIEGVLLIPLKIMPANGGPVLKMASTIWPLIDNHPLEFGEIYFSEVRPGCVKAWKRHFRQTQRFAVPVGNIQLVLYDGRPVSRTKGKIFDIILGRPGNYSLLIIPPMIWYGFKCEGDESALICNLADIPHNPDESERIDVDSGVVPWSWS